MACDLIHPINHPSAGFAESPAACRYDRGVAEQEFDPERGRAAAEKLRALGVRGVLLQAAEQGRITHVACKMPECYCPEDLGGACYFEPRGTPLTDWMPTADHFPKLKSKGGHLTVDDVRLAHRLCNRVDYSRSDFLRSSRLTFQQVRGRCYGESFRA